MAEAVAAEAHGVSDSSGIMALTHVPSPNMGNCQLTHLPRVPIDYGLAVRQHEAYCRMLRDCGAEVRTLDVNRDLPDCTFIEDTAIVLDEVALLGSLGTEARRSEPAGIEPELRKYREVQRIESPATLEGGDVLRINRTLLIGISSRTNAAGISALEQAAGRYGYTVLPVPLRDCLHLKTACTALDDHRLLINPKWLQVSVLRGYELVQVPEEEPWAANIVRVGANVCLAAAHRRTADLVSGLGYNIHSSDLSEFAKAEGAVTCLNLLFRTKFR
jgi:dimethylargininase